MLDATASLCNSLPEVGALREGLRADLLIIRGNHNDPLRAVIEADPDDAQLVLIEGVPLYGDRRAMRAFWSDDDLDEIPVSNERKSLARDAAGFVFRDVVARLMLAFFAEGVSLPSLTGR